MNPIAYYCKQEAEGWNKLPPEMVLGDEQFSCAFINPATGLHMMASMKDFGVLQVIHLSIGPIKSFKPELTDHDWAVKIQDSAFEIAKTFFPYRQFARQPDDQRKPDVKHYFAVIGVDE